MKTGDSVRLPLEHPVIHAVAGACRPQEAYFTGMGLCAALLGREVRGGCFICTGGVEQAAEKLSASTGRVVVTPRGSPEVRILVPPGWRDLAGNTIVLAPAGPGGINEHLAGRAFTVMSLAAEISRPGPAALLDPCGGLEDLLGGRIRLVPGAKAAPGPGAVLTALDLQSGLGLVPDHRCAAALVSASRYLGDLPPSRLWHSISQLLLSGSLSEAVLALERYGVMQAIFPEVLCLRGVPQNYYHHLGAWEHTLEALDRLGEGLKEPERFFPAFAGRIRAHLDSLLEGGVKRLPFVALAALVHDAGKASTLTVNDSGRIRFPGHQLKSAKIAGAISRRLGFGRKGRFLLTLLVKEHMCLGLLMERGESTTSRMQLARKLGERCVDMAMISLADRMATRGEASSAGAVEHYRRLAARLLGDYYWDREAVRLASGTDVMIHAGIRAGPEVGRLLFELRVCQREGHADSREAALEFLSPDFKGRMQVDGC